MHLLCSITSQGCRETRRQPSALATRAIVEGKTKKPLPTTAVQYTMVTPYLFAKRLKTNVLFLDSLATTLLAKSQSSSSSSSSSSSVVRKVNLAARSYLFLQLVLKGLLQVFRIQLSLPFLRHLAKIVGLQKGRRVGGKTISFPCIFESKK